MGHWDMCWCLEMSVASLMRRVLAGVSGSPGNSGQSGQTTHTHTGNHSAQAKHLNQTRRWIVGKISSLGFYKLMTNE